jgi:anaphase-promoting complex subunit 2
MSEPCSVARTACAVAEASVRESSSARSSPTLFFPYSLKQRLLHPGASTEAIIEQYISAVRALQLVDPSGQTLESVAEPIRLYLRCRVAVRCALTCVRRGRPDAIRCIVSKLTNEHDEENNELFEELRRGQEGLDDANDAEEQPADKDWQPELFDPEHVMASGA